MYYYVWYYKVFSRSEVEIINSTVCTVRFSRHILRPSQLSSSCDVTANSSHVLTHNPVFSPLLSLVADLRKRFERAPLSIAVEIDSPVQLQCLPPDGLPQPKVRGQRAAGGGRRAAGGGRRAAGGGQRAAAKGTWPVGRGQWHGVSQVWGIF